MRKIQEHGLQKRQFNRFYKNKPVCHGTGSNFESVGMIDCSGAFVIFAVGLALSVKVCLIEILVKKYVEIKNADKVVQLEKSDEKCVKANSREIEIRISDLF